MFFFGAAAGDFFAAVFFDAVLGGLLAAFDALAELRFVAGFAGLLVEDFFPAAFFFIDPHNRPGLSYE